MLCRTEITVDYRRQVCDHWSMLTFACQSHGATSHKASFTSLLVWIMLSLVIRSWLILDMLSIGRTWTLPQRWLSLQMLLFRRFVSRVLIDTVEQSSRLQREECIFFQVKSCTSKSFSREKARASAKTHCEPKTLRQTHRISKCWYRFSHISGCRISGTHASITCWSTWWAWLSGCFPDWHVWQADEQAAPAEPADSSEKKDLRSSYSLNCNLWFSLSQFEHLRYQEWRLQSHSRLKDGGSLSSSSFHCILVLSVAIVAVLVIVVPVLALVLVFCFVCCSCSHCCYDCCYCSSCCSSCSCCSRSCCSCSRCGCGCEPVLDIFCPGQWLVSERTCPIIYLYVQIVRIRAYETISISDYGPSRNKREWTVNESLSISPCRLSLVQVFMLLPVMRLHDLIIHWVRMSWLIYVSMFLVEPNSCNTAQYIHVYIWSAHIYALCKDSNSMTKDCFYLGHAVNG